MTSWVWVIIAMAAAIGAVALIRVVRLRDRMRGEPPPPTEFVDDVLEALDALGVPARPVPDTFTLEVAGGHWIQLWDAYQRFKVLPRREDRLVEVAAAIADWRERGLIYGRADFLADARAAFEAAGYPVVADAEALALDLPDYTVELAPRLGDLTRRAPADVVEELLAQARRRLREPETLDEVADAMFLEVVPLARLAARGQAEGEADLWPLDHRLVGRPALLQGRMARSVGPVLERLGASSAEALSRLHDDLDVGAAEARPFRPVAPGVVVSAFDDPRDASVLLVSPDAFADLGIEGPPVVWPLRSDLVYVSGLDDLDALFALVGKALPLAEPLSLVPLVPEGASGRWGWLVLEAGHPHRGTLDRLKAEQIRVDHEVVRPGLAGRADQGLGLPPAQVNLDGGTSWASWSGPALLPADVDEIRVGHPQAPISPDVLAGDAGLERTGSVPPYLRATSGPPAQLVSDLARRASGE